MNVLMPFVAAFLQATSFTFDKAALNVKRIDWKTYTSISFPLLMLFDALFLFIVHPAIQWSALGGLGGIFVAVTIVTGFITNALYYRALDDDSLHEMQTWGVFIGIPTLLVTSLLFTDERKLAVLIPALIATAAVTWSHLGRGNRLAIRPKTVAFIGWMLLATPAMASMSKIILQTWNPILLELVRDSVLAFIFWLTVATTYLPPSISRTCRSDVLTPFFLAKPMAAGVAMPSLSKARSAGGPLTRSSRSG